MDRRFWVIAAAFIMLVSLACVFGGMEAALLKGRAAVVQQMANTPDTAADSTLVLLAGF